MFDSNDLTIKSYWLKDYITTCREKRCFNTNNSQWFSFRDSGSPPSRSCKTINNFYLVKIYKYLTFSLKCVYFFLFRALKYLSYDPLIEVLTSRLCYTLKRGLYLNFVSTINSHKTEKFENHWFQTYLELLIQIQRLNKLNTTHQHFHVINDANVMRKSVASFWQEK